MKKKKTLFMFIVCYIAYTTTYIARLNLTMSASELQKIGFSASQIGLLGTIFAVVYACGRLVNGIFSDKKPPYVMISLGLVIAGLANIAVGFLPPFIAVAFLWGANAFGQSMLWGSVLCFVAAIYPPEIARKKTSLMVTSIATGNVVGILLGMYVISAFGLRFAFIVPGAITLVLSLAVLLTMNSVKRIEVKETKKHQSIFALFKNKEILLAAFPVFIHGMIKENVSLWMSVYFIYRYKVDLKASAYFILFIPIAGFIGRLFYGFIYKLSRENEHTVSIIAFILCAVFCVPLILSGTPKIIATVCLGLIYAAASIINSSFISIYPLRYMMSGNVASVCGVLDLAAYGGTAAGSYVFGLLIDKYVGGGYVAMFAIWAVTSLVSVIFTAIIAKRTN